jgi:hypothetical protein
MSVTLVIPTITVHSSPKILEVPSEAKVSKFAQNDKFRRSHLPKKTFESPSQLAIKKIDYLSVDQYPIEKAEEPNNLKNLKFVKEASENFCSKQNKPVRRDSTLDTNNLKDRGFIKENFGSEQNKPVHRETTLEKIALLPIKSSSARSKKEKVDLRIAMMLKNASNLK